MVPGSEAHEVNFSIVTAGLIIVLTTFRISMDEDGYLSLQKAKVGLLGFEEGGVAVTFYLK